MKDKIRTSLEELQAGDKVIWNSASPHLRASIEIVERVTKQYITINGQRFRKEDGYPTKRPASYFQPWISVATEERIREVQLENDRYAITNFRGWGEATDDEIATIILIVKTIKQRRGSKSR